MWLVDNLQEPVGNLQELRNNFPISGLFQATSNSVDRIPVHRDSALNLSVSFLQLNGNQRIVNIV